ncbi:MAG TPA: hydroxyacylglutathione hydrolase, partial [Pseudomonadota bacterium]|nr:hydroxyacylglutathione hydrolase [Pseudomonadota bacterium]
LEATPVGGALRGIKLQGVEVIRGLHFLIRDRNWATMVPKIRNQLIEQRGTSFRVTFEAEGETPSNGVGLVWKATITGSARDGIVFEAEATPEAKLLTARTGFIVLHPLDRVVGCPVTIERGDGRVDEARFPDLAVYGYSGDFAGGREGRVPAQTVGLDDGQESQVLGRRVQVLHIPGHTLTAIAFYFPDDGLLFTGDTLFAAGCGRLFEGTPAQMHASLRRLAALPGEVRVYCGHEYTLKNLSFAAVVEPDNAAVRARSEQAAQKRAKNQPTVPSTLHDELQTNPFLRAAHPAVRSAAAHRSEVARPMMADDDVEVFARIRRWRDEF